MLIFENQIFSTSLLRVGEETGRFFALPVRKKKENELSRLGRYAAGELFRRYYFEACGAAATQEILSALRPAETESGKPFLPAFPDFHYNISHSDDYAVAVYAKNADVGVDIQKIRSYSEKIAARCFSEAELRQLQACAAGRRDVLFTKLWTEYEAALKADGRGILALSGDDVARLKQEMYLFDGGALAPKGYLLTIGVKKA